MKIVIISAMDEELEPIIDYYQSEKISTINGHALYCYQGTNHEFLLINSGVGKVNAAVTTALLIERLSPDLIISIGTAGGVSDDLAIADFVVADQMVFHDVNVESFGYTRGQIPGEPSYFKIADSDKMYRLLTNITNNVHIGTIATGDQFIDKLADKQEILNNFTNVSAIEMESTAIVMTAQHLGVAVYVVRTISDLANSDSKVDFKEYLAQVATNFIQLIKQIDQEWN